MNPKKYLAKNLERFNLLYGHSLTLTLGVILFTGAAMVVAAFLFVNTAAPDTLTITSGPPGSTSQKNAAKYKTILAKEGITLRILPSGGSADNLKILTDPKVIVDVGFVQGGDTAGINTDKLMSLGSVSYQPLMIFYHGKPKTLLSQFKGQQLDIGPEGSGTRAIALTLLKANDIAPGGDTTFVSTSMDQSVKALLDGRIDALFMMGDSASTDLMKQLIHAPHINLFNMVQADGYTRRISYLNKLVLPEGAIDFGKNVPAEDLYLVGPTVELIARENLHPALSDALLEAAREVHGTPSLFRKRGEFPAPLEHDIRISPDATRYYSTGKSFLYRTFPFWVASLISRILAVIVPLALLLIPGLKLVPLVYRWRVQSRIYPWYKTLLELERDAFNPAIDKKGIQELLQKLDDIEHKVNKIKIPASFGDLYYSLRGHIGFVRDQLLSVKPSA
ncbi:MAG TPA: TAXI family TRAP transporter solute-binding subunit [Methylophilaceae bacterium]